MHCRLGLQTFVCSISATAVFRCRLGSVWASVTLTVAYACQHGAESALREDFGLIGLKFLKGQKTGSFSSADSATAGSFLV